MGVPYMGVGWLAMIVSPFKRRSKLQIKQRVLWNGPCHQLVGAHNFSRGEITPVKPIYFSAI